LKIQINLAKPDRISAKKGKASLDTSLEIELNTPFDAEHFIRSKEISTREEALSGQFVSKKLLDDSFEEKIQKALERSKNTYEMAKRSSECREPIVCAPSYLATSNYDFNSRVKVNYEINGSKVSLFSEN